MVITYPFKPTLLSIVVYKSISYMNSTVCTATLCSTDDKSVAVHSVTHLYICLNSSPIPFCCTYNNTRAFSVTDITPPVVFNIDT